MSFLVLVALMGAPEVELRDSALETFVLPSVAYTPRTSVLLGAGVILSFEDPRTDGPSPGPDQR